MRELRNAACELASWGWKVHPLKPRSKQPLTKNGLLDATDDLATVLGWWQRWPTANIGVNCRESGLLVLDVDPRNGGDETFIDLEFELGALTPSLSAKTGGGGMHYFFRHPEADVVGKLGEGVDIKSRGYILAAPSIHPSGGRYEWDVEGEPGYIPDPWFLRIVSPVRVNAPRPRRVDHGDDLRAIAAVDYIARLTGREANRAGFVQCPFHGGGQERTPSLKVTDTLWACHACAPMWGKRSFGGNIYDFAGLLWGYAVPLRGADFAEVASRLRGTFA